MTRVAKRWYVLMACVCCMWGSALPASAAGPFDGVWFTRQSCPSSGFLRTFVNSVTENDAVGTLWGATFNVVIIVADPVAGGWNVDLGTRIDSTIQGQVFSRIGNPLGVFTITASNPTTITGTAQIEGISCSLVGTRVF